MNINILAGTSRWGEYGDGGLLWGECYNKYFEWFDGDPLQELLGKVCSMIKYFTSQQKDAQSSLD
jgi:hypothetical protein